MENLTRSRRSSSSAAESDISDMENEIMQKSGIQISKESESPTKVPGAPQPILRMATPAPEKRTTENNLPASSAGNFVSGVEEDLNLIQA